MSEVTVVAVADKDPNQDYLMMGWNAFNKSLRRFGHEPLILGWGQPWKGLGSKPKLLKKAIEDGRVSTEYLIFTDALDVAFVRRPEFILSAWEDHYPDAAIVWNGERNCFPCTEWAEYHPKTRCPYRYLNSGLAVGRTRDFLQVLTEMKVDDIPDDHQLPNGTWKHYIDQHFFMEKFLFGQCAPHEVKQEIDSECYLFQTMVGETMDRFRLVTGPDTAKLLYNAKTMTHPLAVHWNGPSKTAGTMEPILKHLDLL